MQFRDNISPIMISFLSGKLIEKYPTKLIIEVNGVGFEVNISLTTYQEIGPQGTTISLFTYLHVRDESLQLFGFCTKQERQLFLMLISIPGIGPKLTQLILSGANVQELKKSILEEDISKLISIPGIGRKTAQRIVFDLKEKIASGEKMKEGLAFAPVEASRKSMNDEAILALISLGYNKSSAENAIRKVWAKQNQIQSLDELIKKALSEVK